MEEWREVYAEKGSITAGLERRGKKEKKKKSTLAAFILHNISDGRGCEM